MDKKEAIDYETLHTQLIDLSNVVQNSESDNETYRKQLQKSIEELHKIHEKLESDQDQSNKIASTIERDQAIQGEKNSNIFYQLEQLERRIVDLEKTLQNKDDHSKQFIEKVVMVIIGMLIPYIFNLMVGN